MTVRGAISIARRFQDPLAELVKIDPKSIGVGQYQHDVNQRKLKHKLTEVVQFVVNQVGVELNSASASLLEYVSGINCLAAQGHRRVPLPERAVPVPRGAAERAHASAKRPSSRRPASCASATRRIRWTAPPCTPKATPSSKQMAADLGVSVKDLVGNAELARQIDPNATAPTASGLPTLRDIVEELKKPGRDPRRELTSFEFDTDLKELADLKEGMVLPGIVTNVTDFGAFVDMGVHQDGLVHRLPHGSKRCAPPMSAAASARR